MRKLGEQWVVDREDGQHMFKSVKGMDCEGCAFGFCDNEFTEAHGCSRRYNGGCPFLGEEDLVAKDLGILRDGLLPCPFCGEYPEIKIDETSMGIRYGVFFRSKNVSVWVGWFLTRQQAIEEWNRRA